MTTLEDGSDKQPNPIRWLRESSPYIHHHRGRTFVVYLGSACLDHPNFQHVVSDIALLHSLGVKLILVHGATAQLDAYLGEHGIDSSFHDDTRITDDAVLEATEVVIGRLRLRIEARLSMGLINSPMHGAAISVVTGNIVRAKPLGVRDGVDFQHTGEVRGINADALEAMQELGAIVLVSPIGFSLTGDVFNLPATELARELAVTAGAQKLILVDAYPTLEDGHGERITELETSAVDDFVAADRIAALHRRHLLCAKAACEAGIDRCHLVEVANDGALLLELLTREGSGLQVTRNSYEQIRPASVEDVPGIIELIAPLEQAGVLVRRSRDQLEREVGNFRVISLDGMVIGCAALYTYGDYGELACLAIHPEYRKLKRGQRLLATIEKAARDRRLKKLFVLTTQSTHWFLEQGYTSGDIEELPAPKRELYNYQRNSRLLYRPLA